MRWTSLPGFLLLALCGNVVAADADVPACTEISGSAELLTPGRVVLLGELHGTNESPAFVASLACNAVAAGLDVVVGLELSTNIESRVNAFLGSAGGPEDRQRLVADNVWQQDYQDGRNSRAMVRLLDALRRLRGHGPSVQVLLFDAGGRSQERERGMAANVTRSAREHPRALHLVLTGNLHSRVAKGSRRNAEHEPMGFLIATSLSAERVTALDAARADGAAWVCNPGCGISELRGHGDVPAGTIEIDDATRPAGHAGWYGVGAISASPPASGTFCRTLLAEQEPTLAGDYRAFDQTPGAGWRKLGKNECLVEGTALIDSYIARHETLSASERRILSFHAGQLLARDGAASAAIPRFERAIDEGEAADDRFKWNAYVRATIAFLGDDRDELLVQREKVAEGAPRGGRVPNLDVVDRLIAGFGNGYRTAYAGPPRAARKEPHDAPTPSPQASSTASVEKWQGQWQAYEYGARSWTIRIEGHRFHGVLGPDDWYKGRIEIRPDTSPAEIDFHIEDCRCSYEGQASNGIYRWDGDSILLVAPQPGSSRPTIFDEDTGSMVRLKLID